MPDRAADYLEAAAGHALSLHAYDTAALHLARAAEALARIEAAPARRYATAARREEVLDVLAHREEQGSVLTEMEGCAAPPQRSEVQRRRANWLAHLDRFTEAEESAAAAVASAKSADDGGALVAALTTMGMIACWAGRAAEGVVHLEEAARYRSADPRRQADTRTTLGHNLIDLQRFDEAESQLLAAMTLYTQVGDARGEADVLGMLATLRMERGEPDRAAADYLRAIEISRSIGWRSGEAVYQLNLGILEAIRGRLAAALEAFEASLRIYAAMDNNRGRALVLANSAWLRHAYLGDDQRAEAETLEALEHNRSMREIRGESQCLATLGSIATRRHAFDQAREQLHEAIKIARDAEDSWLGAQILRQLAEAEMLAGCATNALGPLGEASSICETAGMEDLAVGVRALYGRALLACGRVEDADAETAAAAAELRPGIDQGYLVSYARAQALGALGDDDGADRHLRQAHDDLMGMLSGIDEADRHRALTSVPAHAEIVAAWERRRPRTATVSIAAAGAPGGRLLGPDEKVEVTWTVSTPADDRIPERVDRRRHRLVRLIAEAEAQGGAPTIEDLSTALGSSPATVRRDLAALRASGRHIETRGTRHPGS